MSSVPPLPAPHAPEDPRAGLSGAMPPPPPAELGGSGGRPTQDGADRWAPWAGLAALLVGFAIAAFGAVLVGIVAGLAGSEISDSDDLPPAATIAATVIQDVGLILGAVLFAWMLGGRPRPTQFGLIRAKLTSATGWLFAIWLGFVVFSAAWTVFGKQAFGIEQEDDLPQQLGADESTAALVAVAILVCVLAPITEEFFFRGFFFRALRNWHGFWPAAIGTGIVFGGIHALSSPAWFLVPLAAFGFGLCALYQLTGSLLPCIALHALNNSLALGVTQDWQAGEVIALMAGSVLVTMAVTLPLSARRPLPS